MQAEDLILTSLDGHVREPRAMFDMSAGRRLADESRGLAGVPRPRPRAAAR